MRRTESAAVYEEFVKAHDRLYILPLEGNSDNDLNVVRDQFDSILAELLPNLELFSKDQQAFILAVKEKTSWAIKFKEFLKAHDRLNVFLRGEENPDDDLNVVGNQFNSLLSELLSNLQLLSVDQQTFVTAAKK